MMVFTTDNGAKVITFLGRRNTPVTLQKARLEQFPIRMEHRLKMTSSGVII
jgi:hypothetical protein